MQSVSICDSFPEDKRRIKRTTGSMFKTGYKYQWPRFYGKLVKDSIKAKHWELRKYLPTTEKYQ